MRLFFSSPIGYCVLCMEDEFDDHEKVKVCEQCESYQDEIYRLQVALRDPPSGEDARAAYKALNAFVEVQQHHQREHIYTRRELEDMEIERQLELERKRQSRRRR